MLEDFELTEADVDREIVRRGGLYAFLELAWPEIEGAGTPFVGGWHLEEICTHLEAVTRGDCTRIVINVPPGFSKSTVCSVVWPIYHWIFHPHHRLMAVSFDQAISLRDAEKSRRLLASAWFQERWGDKVSLLVKQGKGARQATQAKSFFYTNQLGFRMSTMFGGRATGFHADVVLVDDPIKPATIQGGGDQARKALEKVRTTWQGTFASRTRGKVSKVLIMQRLHEDDLAATCIADGWTHLCLPMELELDRKCITPWGGDRRTQEGELLAPGRVGKGDAEAVAQAKRDLGARHYASQYQQTPSPSDGSIFKREWFSQKWTTIPAGATWWQSWDMAFKGTADSDFVVGTVWAKAGDDFYCVDMIRARMGFTATCQAVLNTTAKWPQSAYRVLVEAKANGDAVVDALNAKVPGLTPVEPRGGKSARANAVSPIWESGHVLYPEGAEWLGDLVEEFVKFPLGANDDICDSSTQAVADQMPKEKNRYAALAKALTQPASIDKPMAVSAPRYEVRKGDVVVRVLEGQLAALNGFAIKAGFAPVTQVQGDTYAIRDTGAREEAVRYAVQRQGLGQLV